LAWERERYADNPAPVRARYERYRDDPAMVARMRGRNSRYQMTHRVAVTTKTRLWRQANPDKAIANHQRRRARKLNAPRVERLNHRAIIERDNSTCYLWCKRELARSEITFDHVIPLARGGSHTMDNLRVACKSCNSRKSTRLLSELTGL
jgi:5-methylcytosine-specific restriction endonuclease McrA